MSFRQNYNGCKTFGCRNCGNPNKDLYHLSERLGYPAWHCDLCGAYPPELLDAPILALAKQIQQRHYLSYLGQSCTCIDTSWLRYGRTPSGSQRMQCRSCTAVVTLPNATLLGNRLQPWLSALMTGVKPQRLQQELGLTNKVFNQHIEQLCQLLNCYTHHIEQQAFAVSNHFNLYSFSHTQACRSGLRLSATPSQAAYLWTLTTIDSQTGYVYLISDNALQNELATDYVHQPWLNRSQYQAKEKEVSVEDEADVLLRAEKTYQKILARSQFDQIGYCHPTHSQLKLGKSNQNALLRPVYAAHAHMQNLYQYFPKSVKIDWLLEHESFIRGAAITSFSESVANGTTDLYYYHYSLNCEPENSLNEKRTISWWNEKWHKIQLWDEGRLHQVGLGILTAVSEEQPEKLRQRLPKHLDISEHFWLQFEDWLPAQYTHKLSATRIQQWQTLYRYLHNFVLTDKQRIAVSNPASLHSIAAMVTELNANFVANSKTG